jgi:hypothetical protein
VLKCEKGCLGELGKFKKIKRGEAERKKGDCDRKTFC